MTETDLFKLYAGRVLALAANIPGEAPLQGLAPGQTRATARARAPMCGSTVAVDLALEQGRIAGFHQTVHACALGQASAAIFGAQVLGLDRESVAALHAALADMLKGGPVPQAPFGEYEVLTAARDYPNRHASILLAPAAVLAAFDAREETGAP